MHFWSLNVFGEVPNYPFIAKVDLFFTACVTILLYGCESWVLSQYMDTKINFFATSCYKIMVHIKINEKTVSPIPSYNYTMINTGPLVYCVRKRQLGLLGHILPVPEEELNSETLLKIHMIIPDFFWVYAFI